MSNISDIYFSDIYIRPDRKTYIADKRTANGLVEIELDDLQSFYDALNKGFDGSNSSYSIEYGNSFYRVERSEGVYGIQFCARKMPAKVQPFSTLGFPDELNKFLYSLSNHSGLILWSGPTGQGKTTAISSLLKEYLSTEGGFAYTIEDPTEHPLDGVYHSLRGGLGVCTQTQPKNDDWGSCLKSALRSKPRYILVGEIRTPDTASEVLRAATSGHLVLSTIHANNITDAINSVVKYASSSSMSESLAYDLFSRGMLGVLYQTLSGVTSKKPNVSYLFANPNNNKGDQVRGIIKTGKLSLATAIETQMTRLSRGMNIFPDI